ncbi:universal stress protein [Nonomuraea sp. NPDC049480]|uniref:universal stress protein n=1 Tax=Nonomuraea sp. NPDC049480 TaxID=3364353 RepID=UPI00378F5A21
MMNRAIVVGVDGSQAAKSALTWAAENAARRSLPLRIVQVREPRTAEHLVPAVAESSQAADLVVVGSRGLGGFASAALGSVSYGILHRACCPLAVIGTGWRRS